MSASLEREKERLLERSSLCRLRLVRQSSALRDSLRWRPMAAAASPGVRGALLVVAWSLPRLARAARFVSTAVRIVVVAKLALSLAGHARALASAARRGTRSPRSIRIAGAPLDKANVR